MAESLKDKKERASKIISALKKEYGIKETALLHKNILELLIATMLSAQCTDKRVNIVTESLFKKYRAPLDYINARQEELENDIKSTGFYKNKAKNIKGACKIIYENFNSKVPDTMENLLTLPGVARKTANIVLSEGYGIIEGIAVDTHVTRLSLRLRFTETENAAKIEKDLMELIPEEDWRNITNLLIHHGRNICIARKPKCDICIISKLCPSALI